MYMTSLYKKQAQTFKNVLKIEKIISIRFSDIKNKNFKKYQDTACTALARSFGKNICTFIDRQSGQLCAGGNYFLNVTKTPTEEVCEVYVKEERVFANNQACSAFIKDLPKYPRLATRRYILISPLSKEISKPDVIMMLVNPAQAGRILGLSVNKKMSYPLVIPALSTCASIYAPIDSNKIHLNFIDYFDRYYQGKQGKKLFWKESELIISMPYKIFQEIVETFPRSAHGSFRPKLKPQKVEAL